jgi:hypothetical protein
MVAAVFLSRELMPSTLTVWGRLAALIVAGVIGYTSTVLLLFPSRLRSALEFLGKGR